MSVQSDASASADLLLIGLSFIPQLLSELSEFCTTDKSPADLDIGAVILEIKGKGRFTS